MPDSSTPYPYPYSAPRRPTKQPIDCCCRCFECSYRPERLPLLPLADLAPEPLHYTYHGASPFFFFALFVASRASASTADVVEDFAALGAREQYNPS